ncbi:hypothetical protein P875_00076140 [Aspergillus parasiticus SU-1]|uniref:Uncharacterized protein n=7 Tax=Aspergillus subgen. Circumdati TaxID=2720871 RepID=A0A2G7GA33_9EURO|nr:hypothetical protein BDV34DRAFT_229638 [Aspergillus parasiticus]KAB8218373.1 hypothetical protein BDV33DRAFT_205415 [Aspergillus novoparasiticus]KAB8267198.1 hypothetical protein BDV30DRAFT_220553 [Aspergillus minisclerotigenes]KAE8314251.1 hypothetical protein BDV41DRAFT_534649 [Aspergillus transmontanensis]KAE8331806.1 hypothetical protein BDV39DRAFT_150723 [Aspergillus sergii]KAE8345726.1 hypothetical protein BDV24DRAFT_159058 [Aspergillus arachidicola]KJK68357.1 hypothetical protein P8
MASTQKARRLILTTAVVSITIAGTLYGAGIKTEQEVTQTVQKKEEASIDERIASLRGMRQNLAAKKELVERQINDLDARVEERKRKGIDGSKREPSS